MSSRSHSHSDSSMSLAIAPQALLAWARIPSDRKAEILEVFRSTPSVPQSAGSAERSASQDLRVLQTPSGFKVVVGSEEGRTMILSVLTPREAGQLSAA